VSLLDGLIEDGLTNPLPYAAGTGVRREVFVAIRTDGATGPGTPEDPYNGAISRDRRNCYSAKQSQIRRYPPARLQHFNSNPRFGADYGR
jgi:hypothetical protein